MTLCAMLCTARSVLSAVRSSSMITVEYAGRIMLERENLAPVAQRALRQQPDFREAVDDDALRLEPLDRIEDPLTVSPSSRSEE